MLSGARAEAIKKILAEKKTVTVAELSRKFSVSSSTVRRDLKCLESAYVLKRSYGGALSWEHSLYAGLSYKEKNYREIAKVAKLALSLIKPKDTIYLDGGAITLVMARRLKKVLPVNVVTNSIKIAIELASLSQINLTLTGGNLKFPEFTLQGPLSETLLEKLHVNKSFIDGVSIEARKGLTANDILSARMKQIMIKKADKSFVLVLSKDFGRLDFTTVCPLSEIDLIITNKRLSNKVMSEFHKREVDVKWG